jgi:hypothetical protein
MHTMAKKQLTDEEKADLEAEKAVQEILKSQPVAVECSKHQVKAPDLKKELARLVTKRTFKVGDIVRYKPGMENAMKPEAGSPAIVVDVLDCPVYDSTQTCGSPHFREPLDIILGMMAEDEDATGGWVFLTYYYDSRRFEPYK